MMLSASPYLMLIVVPLLKVILIPERDNSLLSDGLSFGTRTAKVDDVSLVNSWLTFSFVANTDRPCLDIHLPISLGSVCIVLHTARNVIFGIILDFVSELVPC